MDRKRLKKYLKDVWWFVWEDDSISSWIVNVVLAFILVKFIIYPALGFMLGTSLPVVAVVSSSMEHNGLTFDNWWESHERWYLERNITKEEMESYSLKNGFNKGDIIILIGVEPKNIVKGMVIVYSTEKYKYPIIHRVVNLWEDAGFYFETKGDNNIDSDPEEIHENRILGRAVFKIPYLGRIKLLFTEIIGG